MELGYVLDITTTMSSSYRKVFMGSLQCVQGGSRAHISGLPFSGEGELDICLGV